MVDGRGRGASGYERMHVRTKQVPVYERDGGVLCYLTAPETAHVFYPDGSGTPSWYEEELLAPVEPLLMTGAIDHHVMRGFAGRLLDRLRKLRAQGVKFALHVKRFPIVDRGDPNGVSPDR